MFVRLALISLLSWTFVIGLFIEMLNDDRPIPDQIIIFGVVRDAYHEDEHGEDKITVYDGRTEWILQVEKECNIPDKGTPVLVFCEFQEGGELLVSRIVSI